MSFILGVLSGLVAAFLYSGITILGWPIFKDKYLYQGIKIAGSWDISESRSGESIVVGTIDLKQTGHCVTGTATRTQTRGGKQSTRTFQYNGFIRGHQLTMSFDDASGVGFDTGTYVFIVQNDRKTMEGMATFYGKIENKIVSEPRSLVKVVS